MPACALAAEQGGADAVSLINTLRAMALAPAVNGARARPWLGGRTGGLSGPAVRAVALAQVAAVAERVRIPVIGMGGVQTGAHARELLEVGASLVAVGTESFRDPGRRPPDRPRTAGARPHAAVSAWRYFSAVSGDAPGRPGGDDPSTLAADPLRVQQNPCKTTPDRGPASMNLHLKLRSR